MTVEKQNSTQIKSKERVAERGEVFTEQLDLLISSAIRQSRDKHVAEENILNRLRN